MKKVLISILTVFFITSMLTTVYAATGSISLGASSDTVIKGKTFTVTLAGTADNNITGLEASLSYDNTKLSIDKDATKPGLGFSDLSGGNEIAIVTSNTDSLSKSGTLYTITFKVLDTAIEGETTITVSNAVLALVTDQSVQEDTEPSSDEVTITIKADDTTVGGGTGDDGTGDDGTGDDGAGDDGTGDNGTGDDGIGDNGSGNDGASDENKETSKDKKPAKLPQTGIKSTVAIAIVALGILSTISYILYRKNNDIK